MQAAALAWGASTHRNENDKRYTALKYRFNWNDEANTSYIPLCFGDCYLGVSALRTGLGQGDGYTPSAENPPVAVPFTRGETLGTIRQRFIAQHETSGEITVANWSSFNMDSYNWDTLCLSFVTWAYPAFTVGRPLPGAPCGGVSPPNLTCSALASMTFNFGAVTAGKLNGLQRSQPQTLTCSNASNVTLKLVNPLTLSPSLGARLSVNSKLIDDKDGASFAIAATGATLNFVVTLAGNEKTAGYYQASSVLMMSYR